MRSTNGPTFEAPLIADRHQQSGMQYLHLRMLTLLFVQDSHGLRLTFGFQFLFVVAIGNGEGRASTA
jgi:hypothetical protein